MKTVQIAIVQTSDVSSKGGLIRIGPEDAFQFVKSGTRHNTPADLEAAHQKLTDRLVAFQGKMVLRVGLIEGMPVEVFKTLDEAKTWLSES